MVASDVKRCEELVASAGRAALLPRLPRWDPGARSRGRSIVAWLAVALVASQLANGFATVQATGAEELSMVAGAVDALPFGAICPPEAPVRSFHVVAAPVPISYNHWGDFDPAGMMYVLAEDLPDVLSQVSAQLSKAGLGTLQGAAKQPGTVVTDPRRFDVSPLVEPLVLRAHVGDCVDLHLTNLLHGPTSIHVHGALSGPGDGMALGLNRPDLAPSGASATYRVFIPDLPGMEGAHLMHSHADARYQMKHGLFGALVAEPKGTTWFASDGTPSRSGTQAIIDAMDGPDFREFVVIYHDEAELVDRALKPLPTVDKFFAYGPGSKAINYRSEPFMNRFELHSALFTARQLDRGHDKSQAYGSYTYGDGAVFMPLSYVGDPTKFRLLNAGPGAHHAHHLHGGGVRWRATPLSDDTQFAAGLVKDNPFPQSRSERIDVQMIGPGESFNAEIEGGSGGVQQSVGDFLLHCHVVEHYLAGMWSIWRVHNTLRPGLAELPDRAGRVAAPVNSVGLLGRTLRDGSVVNASNLGPLVEPQLPPQGVPGPNDASVWDWDRLDGPEGPLYLGEPETAFVWPNYESTSPGSRPELLFNPDDGRLSYPFLRPHLGKRPPFAPGHGPAPYLGLDATKSRPDGLCPPNARPLDYNVVATGTMVRYNQDDGFDPKGEIFVLAEDKADVLSGARPAQNLVIRANQGDCVDVLLTSQLDPNAITVPNRKVNMHTHLVQFDIQGSDGIITGFNFEQSILPATTTGTAISSEAAAGDRTIQVQNPAKLRPGTTIGLGLTEPHAEIRTIVSINGSQVLLDEPLGATHAAAERVGPEFVRYRWYADVELGMVYWHDHVDGLNSWRRGLYGGLVVEPRGSTWYSPRVDPESPDERAPIRSGTVADIVNKGPKGSYREFVAVLQDRTHCIPTVFHCSSQDNLVQPTNPEREIAALNLRSSPFRLRNATYPLLSSAGSVSDPSVPQGDPATDLWEAYPGDPVVVRLLYGGQASTRAMATFSVTGHRFRFEQHNPDSRLVDALSFGIASQHNLRVECGAGGCLKLAGDYLYYITQPDVFDRGAWGIFRVHDEAQDHLFALPGHPAKKIQAGSLPEAPVRRYEVVALEANVMLNLRTLTSAPMQIFALAEDVAAIRAGLLRPTPLVVRAHPGELVEVELRNELTIPVTMHASLLAADPRNGMGIPVGRNPDSSVRPGAVGTFRWYADKELGAAHLATFGGNAANNTLTGLYGALVVEPSASIFSPATGPHADVLLSDGRRVKEHVLLYASSDPVFESGIMPYTVDVVGPVTVNYRTESLHNRAGRQVEKPTGDEVVGGMGVHSCQINAQTCIAPFTGTHLDARSPLNPWVLSSLVFTDPETPILHARRGEPLWIRSLGGTGDQLQVASVSGHWWLADPGKADSNVVDFATIGPREASNAWIERAGPGGSGDYLWGSHRLPFLEAGAWGLVRVRDCPVVELVAGGHPPDAACLPESTVRRGVP